MWMENTISWSMDASAFIRAGLEDGKDAIQRGTWDGLDQNGATFVPLKPTTIERKEKGYARYPEKPLIDTTDMVSDQRFHMTVGKHQGTCTHSASGYLSHTRVPYVSKRGRATRRKTSIYDYGLAHQYSRMARLPIRAWWMDPGSRRHEDWRKRLLLEFRQSIFGGGTVIRGRTESGEQLERVG
jgi:hypothetical protein